MNKKSKAIIAVGGTGGHVFPGCNLAHHLIENNYEVELISDKRGSKYLRNIKNLSISIHQSTSFNSKNIFTRIFSSIFISYFILKSVILLLLKRPAIVFGMGGYASFPICIAAGILNIRFIIYENNLVLGKANRYLLPFTEKILVSFKDIEGIPNKYNDKIFEIGNLIKKEIINFPHNNFKKNIKKKIGILVLGGSQAAKVFAEKLPEIFLRCSKNNVPIKIYQHCLPTQNEKLKSFYRNANIDFEIFNFSNNLIEYFSKVNLAITRSGSSMLAELTNANIPFISVPLPSSADNHQLKNAIFYERKKLAFLVEEKNIDEQLSELIIKIFNNNSLVDEIISNQEQYSDKNVYNKISEVLKEIVNEKY